MARTNERLLSTCISGQHLALLKKLDYPCSERVLASATLIEDEGFEITGNRYDFETSPAGERTTAVPVAAATSSTDRGST